jgi:microcystin-dependent protein
MSKRRTLQLSEGMTGTVIATILTAAPTGWLMFNGDTLGSASSAATRASADFKELFVALWNSLTNTDAPVSGGRGESASADWTANKTITLPDMRGRSIIGTGTGSGLTARTHGAKVGAEDHMLTEAQMPLHGHPLRTSAFAQATAPSSITGGIMISTVSNANQTAFTGTPSATLGQQVGGTGGGTAHNNMQPSMALNWIVKT